MIHHHDESNNDVCVSQNDDVLAASGYSRHASYLDQFLLLLFLVLPYLLTVHQDRFDLDVQFLFLQG